MALVLSAELGRAIVGDPPVAVKMAGDDFSDIGFGLGVAYEIYKHDGTK